MRHKNHRQHSVQISICTQSSVERDIIQQIYNRVKINNKSRTLQLVTVLLFIHLHKDNSYYDGEYLSEYAEICIALQSSTPFTDSLSRGVMYPLTACTYT